MNIELNTVLFVLAKIPIAMFCKNEKHEYIWCNDAFTTLLETKTENILHKTPKEVLCQMYKAVEKSDEEVLKFDSDSYDISFTKKDGALRKYLVHKQPIKSANGKNISFGIMLDVTENIIMQETPIESERLFRQFADSIKEVFWVRTSEKMLYINKAYEELWGMSRDEIYQNSSAFLNTIVDNDRQRVIDAFASEMNDPNYVFDEEYRIKNGKDETVWIHARSYPIFDQNGKHVRSTGIARDVTARKQLGDISKRLNEALSKKVYEETQKRREHELAFEGIFDIAGSCLCIIDEGGIIVDANRQFLNLFDMRDKKEELIGLSFKKLLDPKEYARAEAKLAQVSLDCENHSCYCKNSPNCKKTPIPYEWKFSKKNGDEVTILATVACFEDRKTEKHYIVSFTDITRLRELERKQKENERLLAFQSKMAAMGEMIGAIAHQWRQPLNLLGILIQDVQYCYKDGDINVEYIDKFTSSAMEQLYFMSKTIDDFRNFFKSDKELMNFDVYRNVEKSISLVEGMLKAHGIELELNVIKKPIAKGLPNELGQVVLNLVSNAKDALSELKPDKPKIKITINSDEHYAIIDVEDNGGGIKEEIIDRIFEPYFTTKEEGKGTGIGLYMSKTIIEKNMSGKLSVANTNSGVVFTVKIPLP